MSLSWQHCTHFYYSPLSLCLTAAAHVTHLSTRTHTYRDIWTTANQRGGPPFTISDWFRPRYKPNGGLFLNHRTGDTFFSFLEWLDAPVRPGIFVSRTREKLGCTCDQIGRTLEPCFVWILITILHYNAWTKAALTLFKTSFCVQRKRVMQVSFRSDRLYCKVIYPIKTCNEGHQLL